MIFSSITQLQNVHITAGTLRVSWNKHGGHLAMDANTIKRLELLEDDRGDISDLIDMFNILEFKENFKEMRRRVFLRS
jgi:hypothetical protein